jgi:hypothetical protein
MVHELVYTSAARGVRRGATGYCTVAQTADLPAELTELLEMLSRYRHLVKGPDPARNGNPVAHAHSVVTVGYRTYHVLSRIADTGLEQTGRSNYLAHHLVAGPDDLPPAGPAWVLEQHGLFHTSWEADRAPEVIRTSRSLPNGMSEPRRCRKWERATGDAGWAGVLAGATDPGRPAYIVYEPGQDVLGLIAEALALLPSADRWRVTFSTYFTGSTADVACQWRCVLADSPEATAAINGRRGLVLRTDKPMAGAAGGPLAEAARTGVVPARAEPEVGAPRPRTPVSVLPPPEPAPARRSWAADDLPPPEPEPDDEPTPAKPRRSATRPAAEEYPADPPPAYHGGGGVRALVVGLLLGALLGLVAAGVVEIGTGRSLPRHASLVGMDKEDKKDLDAANATIGERDAAIKKLGDDFKETRGKVQNSKDQTQASESYTKKLEGERDSARAEARELSDKLQAEKEHAGDLQKKLKKERNAVAKLEERVSQLNGELARLKGATEIGKKPPEDKKPEEKKPAPTPQQNPVPAPAKDASRPKITGQPHQDLSKAGVAPVKLFGTDIKGRDTLIDLLSLDTRFSMVIYSGQEVHVSDKDRRVNVALKLGENGDVTISGSGLTDPSLGLAVIKVSGGGKSDYRQLFQPAEVKSGPLKAVGDAGRFVLDIPSHLKNLQPKHPLEAHYRRLVEEGEVAFSREPVKLKIDGREIELALKTSDPSGEKISEVKGANGDLIAEASLKDGKIVIEVRRNNGPPPTELTVLSLQLVRVTGGSGLWLVQDLVKVKPTVVFGDTKSDK